VVETRATLSKFCDILLITLLHHVEFQNGRTSLSDEDRRRQSTVGVTEENIAHVEITIMKD
jgi:hypothetical protein